jgi:signal transduction histidine kinase/CheY-like chemotaxis protein
LSASDPIADERHAHREIRASESRLEFAMAGIFTILIAGTLYYVYQLFAPLVPATNLHIWASFTAFVTLVMAVTPIIFFIRRPSPEAIERYWSPFGKLVAILFDLSAAASVWLLLPFASEPLQLLMVIFYSAAISGQVISTAESIGTNVFAVLSIFGSAAIFFLQADTEYAGSVAAFLMAFGGLMIVVALILKQAIRSAIASRLAAERLSGELAVALADAQDARDARTRFIAAASHDLRQPLQAAMLFFQQMRRHPDPARREEAAEGVTHGFAEANALLERMMEHLRIESGAVTVHPEAVALAPLFAALADELRPAATEAKLSLDVETTPLWVRADPTLVTRILRNLMQNAIVHSRAAHLRLSANANGGQVRIIVADDGVGFDDDFAAAAFDAYSQGGQGTGMGLGLSIARELARLMGGELALDGGGKGARFALTLPAASAVAAPVSRGTASEVDLSGIAVLVIDDDRAGATALANLLTLAGADTRAVHDASEIAAVRGGSWRPDVIVTDWHIGRELTGADAIAMLHPAWPDARVLVMTGDAAPATAQDIAATGWPLFIKPVDPAALGRAIAGG